MKEQDLKGKYIVAWDTIVDGHQCATDDKGNPNPELFDSEEAAMDELFDDALSMIENLTDEELEEHGITSAQRDLMKIIAQDGKQGSKQKFLDENPECNYNDEFIVSAEEFVFGRKAYFQARNGGHIEGKKLTDF